MRKPILTINTIEEMISNLEKVYEKTGASESIELLNEVMDKLEDLSHWMAQSGTNELVPLDQ